MDEELRECAWCYGPFRSYRPWQEFCSRRCKDRSTDQRKKRERETERISSPILLGQCKCCSKIFVRWVDQSVGEQRYCSHACSGVALRRQKLGWPMHETPIYLGRCMHCGAVFVKSLHSLRGVVYCSRRCRVANLTERRRRQTITLMGVTHDQLRYA